VVENGMAWLVRAMEPTRPSSGARARTNPKICIIQRLMPADALRVRGRHNAANALAALALATAIGCPLAPMLHGLREYRGEPHRVEHIAQHQRHRSLRRQQGHQRRCHRGGAERPGRRPRAGKLVVILGGDGKGQDFSPLAGPVQRHARAVA
jgi:UDP-N-acetylmuramoylalanine--D-glutamate ligase